MMMDMANKNKENNKLNISQKHLAISICALALSACASTHPTVAVPPADMEQPSKQESMETTSTQTARVVPTPAAPPPVAPTDKVQTNSAPITETTVLVAQTKKTPTSKIKAVQAIQAITQSTQNSQVGLIAKEQPEIVAKSAPSGAKPAYVATPIEPKKPSNPNTASPVLSIAKASKPDLSPEKMATDKPATSVPAAKEQKAPSSTTMVAAKPKATAKTTVLVAGQSVQPKTPSNTGDSQDIATVNAITEKSPTAAGIKAQTLTAEEKAVSAPLSSAKQHNSATIDTPETIGIWQLQTVDNTGQCRLSSATIQLSDRNYSAQLWIDVVDNQLVVNSSAAIDIHQADVGIRIDNGTLTPFTQNRFSNSAILSQDLTKLLTQSHQTLHVYLGSQEFGQGEHHAALNLEDLKKAYLQYQTCQK